MAASELLSKQVGPLPVGAWGVVIAGALGMAYYFNKGQSNGSAPEEQLLAEPGVGIGGGQFIYDEPNKVTPDISIELTNTAWITKAWSYLISQGHNPSVSGTALNKYINGETLSSVEQGLVDIAISKVGVPPESFTPAKPPVTPPATTNQYAISLVTQPPAKVRKGAGMTFNGVVTNNGKPAGGKIVSVEYRNGGTTNWIGYPGGFRKSYGSGKWSFTTRAYKGRQWRFKVYGTSAVVHSRYISVG